MTALKWKRDRPGRQVTTLGWFVVEAEDPGPSNGPLSWAAILINPVGGRGSATATLGVFPTMREAKARCQAQADMWGDLFDEPNVSDDTDGGLGPPDQPPPGTPAKAQGVTTDAGTTTPAETPLVPLAELFPDLIRRQLHSFITENFGCPTCRARRGRPCRTNSGKPVRQPHRERLAKVQTPSDDELHEAFGIYVKRHCPKCGGTEISRSIELHRKHYPMHRHHFHCANCDAPLGYYDKAPTHGPLPRDAGVRS